MISRRDLLTTAGAGLGASLRGQERSSRFLGLMVLPEYVQVEGIDRVLANLQRAGATAVSTSPYLMAPAHEKDGSREPPIDAGAGTVRLLDRPLWGRRELFVRTGPAFTPDARLYAGLRYQPPPPNDLTRREPTLIRDFIRAARSAGLKVYFQVQAAIPPGYRVQFGGPREEDIPRLPDGRVPPRRLANNASLAATHVRAYTEALIRDLCRAYPEIHGIRVDWPEYPPYLLDDVFLDFSEPARAAAARLGFDFARMRADALSAYRQLHGGLSNAQLEAWCEEDGGLYAFLTALADRPGLLELMRFKAALAEETVAGYRRALTAAGGGDKELLPNAFPPPFSFVSGMDYARVGQYSQGISVKLYTMHWPVILRFYADALMAANRGLSEALLVRALVRLTDTAEEPKPRVADYRYPEPGEPHPVSLAAQARKIRQARRRAGGALIYALAHGYGPVDDAARRARAVYLASGRKLWVNRYGYLSDAKLDALKTACGG